MTRIETERLILRSYREEDLADYHAYMSLEYTARHESFEPLSLERCREILHAHLGGDDYLMLERKADGRVIGDISFSSRDYDAYEIGYDMHMQYEGNGYMTEACAAFIRHIFTTVGGRRVLAECNEENARSWRLLERLGFRREGHMIEDVAFKTDAAGEPIYINSYSYALLKREWLLLQ